MQTIINIFKNTLMITVLILTVSAINAGAAAFTVTNTNDSGAGSLRDALLQTGANNQSDTINFAIPASDAGCAAGGVCTITLTSGELVVPPDSQTTTGQMVTITGPGANLLTISGNAASRVFYLDRYAQASMSGLRVTGGNGTGTTNSTFNDNGGGIYVYNGALQLNNVVISGNSAITPNAFGGGRGGGGVFYNSAQTSTITNSTFSDNLAKHDETGGRGAAVFFSGTQPSSLDHTITDSTFTSNRVGGSSGRSGETIIVRSGATISNCIIENNFSSALQASSRLTIENTTIRGNTNGGFDKTPTPGGITTIRNSTISNNGLSSNSFNFVIINNDPAGMTIINSTISNNVGIGVSNSSGTVNIESSTITLNQQRGVSAFGSGRVINLRNTIVAGNTRSNAPADIEGNITSQGYNIVGTTSGGTINQTTGDQFNVNPLLEPLADNGGATQTHALMPDSPAIDKGNSFGLTTDQRGRIRPFDNPSITNATGGDGADIGAFESQAAPTAAMVTISGRVPAGKRGVARAVVYLTDQNGGSRTALTNQFGYYRFDDVEVGQTYILNAYSKRYQFEPQVVTVNDSLDNLNFKVMPTSSR